MKILKHGSPKPKEKISRHFVCPNCGCEFIVDEGEYFLWSEKYLGYKGNSQIVETQCPEYQETVQGESTLIIGDNNHSIIERWSNGEPTTNEQN